MKFNFFVSILAVFFLTICLVPSSPLAADTPTQSLPYAQNQVLVQFTKEAEPVITQLLSAKAEKKSVLDRLFGWVVSWGESEDQTAARKNFEEIQKTLGIKDYAPKKLIPYSPRTIKFEDVPLSQKPSQAYLLKFENGTVQEAMAILKKYPIVIQAQPNYLYSVSAVPNDPLYSTQWTHTITQAEKGWDITTGNRNIVVAVVDSGVNYNHPDLKENMWQGAVEGKNVHGWDFFAGDDDPMDEQGHGTSVSGIIGAIGNNNEGVTGVNWQVTMLPLRAGNEELDTYSLVESFKFAAEKGARIINLSSGGYGECMTEIGTPDDAVYDDIISYLTRSNGILFVAATGNDSVNAACHFPSSHPDVLAVTATYQNDTPTDYSNYGPFSWKEEKIIAAPVNYSQSRVCSDNTCFLTTSIDGTYTPFSGTSAAAPYISGVAALVLSMKDMSPFSLRKHLIETADEINADITLNPNSSIPGDDGKRTYGKRVNIYRALTENSSSQPPSPSGTITLSPNPQNTVTPSLTNTPSTSMQPTPTNLPTPTQTQTDTTWQVDWVFEGQGRCWSAWAAPSCTLKSHEGGATLALRDLNNDGSEDITCSSGNGSLHATTITNTSGEPYSFSCERYQCALCIAAYTGIHAQCDGGNYQNPSTQKETFVLAPGCTATCTINGAYGSCLPQKTPPSLPEPSAPENPQQPSLPSPNPSPTPSPIPGQPTVSTPGPMTDEFIKDVFNRINQKRSENNVPLYTYNEKLSVAAKQHAQDMVKNNFCSHTGSNNSTFIDRIQNAGYSSLASGEIIACGMSNPESAVYGWWNSPGHHDLMLSALMIEIGIGYEPISTNPPLYMIVADMGKPL